MKKLVVFHRAIAPYRIDFFNSLNEAFDASFYFEFGDALEQSFDQRKLKARLNFEPRYLEPGLLGIKNLRWSILRILKKEKPAMVICSEYNLMNILILFYKLFFDRSLAIYTICDDSLGMAGTYSSKNRILRKIVLTYFTGIIMSDRRALEWYREKLAPGLKLLYFPIIQKDEYFRNRLEESLPLTLAYEQQLSLQQKTVLLYVGRLAEVKNLPFLLSVFTRLKGQYPDLALVLVGDGPQKEELVRIVAGKELTGSVFLTGKCEDTELMAWYNLGDLFILPSVYEPFGAVVNEALLAGCYLFCSSVAGASCLIEEPVNGTLFDPANEEELFSELSRYLENAQAKKERSEVKKNRMLTSYDEMFSRFIAGIQ